MYQEITLSEIEISPVKFNKGLVAFASFTLNNQFYVGNIAIYTTLDGYGYRLVYPAKTLTNGKQIKLFHPITRGAGKVIRDAVIEKYRNLTMDIETEKVAKHYENMQHR